MKISEMKLLKKVGYDSKRSDYFKCCYSVGNGLSQFIRRAEDKSNYFIGDRPGYVEACMVPFAWHTHLAKGRGKTTLCFTAYGFGIQEFGSCEG